MSYAKHTGRKAVVRQRMALFEGKEGQKLLADIERVLEGQETPLLTTVEMPKQKRCPMPWRKHHSQRLKKAHEMGCSIM
jgi:hypothetical protein